MEYILNFANQSPILSFFIVIIVFSAIVTISKYILIDSKSLENIKIQKLKTKENLISELIKSNLSPNEKKYKDIQEMIEDI